MTEAQAVVRRVFALRRPDAEPTAPPVPAPPKKRGVLLAHTVWSSSVLAFVAGFAAHRLFGWALADTALAVFPAALPAGWFIGRSTWAEKVRVHRRNVVLQAFAAAPGGLRSEKPAGDGEAAVSDVLPEWAGPPGERHGTVRVAWADPHYLPRVAVVVRVGGRTAGWVADEWSEITLVLPAGRHQLRAWVFDGGLSSDPLVVEVRAGEETALELGCAFAPAAEPLPPPERQLSLRVAPTQPGGATADQV